MQILDATIVAIEVVGSRKSHGKPRILCKLDLKKAFDHVTWEFLDFITMKMVLGAIWRKLIKFYISTSRFSVVVNNKPCGFVVSLRGIR